FGRQHFYEREPDVDHQITAPTVWQLRTLRYAAREFTPQRSLGDAKESRGVSRPYGGVDDIDATQSHDAVNQVTLKESVYGIPAPRVISESLAATVLGLSKEPAPAHGSLLYRRAGLLGFGGVLDRCFSNSCSASVTRRAAEYPVAASRRRRSLSVSRLT